METATKHEALDAEIQAAVDREAARYAPAFPGVVLLFRVEGAYYPSSENRELVEEMTGAPMVPHKSAESRVRQMIGGGVNVAVCEQVARSWHTVKSTARDYRELMEG